MQIAVTLKVSPRAANTLSRGKVRAHSAVVCSLSNHATGSPGSKHADKPPMLLTTKLADAQFPPSLLHIALHRITPLLEFEPATSCSCL